MADLINKVVSRIKMTFCKALIKAVADSDDIQIVKVAGLAGEAQDKIERLQPYGLTTNPPIDSEALVVYLNGARDDGLVIVTDNGTYRIKSIASGEVCLYSQYGQKVLLDNSGAIDIQAATDIKLNGSTDYIAAFTALKTGFDTLRTEVNALITVYNAHSGHSVVGVPPVTPAVPAVATIDAAKVDTVRV